MSRPSFVLLALFAAAHAADAAAPPPADRHGDPLPKGAAARLGSVRWRLGFGEMPLGLSPDGKRVFLSSLDGGVGYFDVDSGKTHRLSRPKGLLNGPNQQPVLSPDGSRALSHDGNDLHLIDTASGKRLWSAKVPQPQNNAVVFDPAGKHFAYYGGDPNKENAEGTLNVHRADTGAKTGSMTFRGQAVAFALAPGGERAVIWDANLMDNGMGRPAWELVFHDLAKNKEIGKAQVRTGMPNVSFRPDGKQVAVASAGGGTVTFYSADAVKGRSVRAASGNSASLFRYSPDGKFFAAVGFRRADLWEVATLERVPTRPIAEADVAVVAFPAPGQLLVAGMRGRELVLSDAVTGTVRRSPAGHAGGVTSLHFSGDEVLTAGGDGKVTHWSLDGRPKRQVTVQNQQGPFDPAVSFRGGVGFAGGGVGFAQPFRGPGGLDVPPGFGFGGHLEFAGAGRYVVADGGMVYDLKAGESRFDDLGEVSSNFGVRVSRDGELLLALGGDDEDPNGQGAKLTAMKLANGETLWTERVAGMGNFRAAVSPDGKAVALSYVSGEGQYAVRLLDGSTGKALAGAKEYEKPGILGQTLEFTADGRLVVGSTGEGLFFLDARTGEPQHVIELKGFQSAAALCPKGRMVAVVPLGEDDAADVSCVEIYEIASGKRRMKFPTNDMVTALCFSPDGRHLGAGHDDGTALLWDLEPARAEARGDAWGRLSGADAAEAYRELWRLRRDPARAVEVTANVKPAPAGPTADQLRKLIEGLDDEDGTTRDQAERELRKQGRTVEVALRAALTRDQSAEVVRRLRRVVAALPGRFTDAAAGLRAVELLEGVGTPEARRRLARLAEGNPSATLTQEAAAALARLGK